MKETVGEPALEGTGIIDDSLKVLDSGLSEFRLGDSGEESDTDYRVECCKRRGYGADQPVERMGAGQDRGNKGAA